MSSNNSYKFKSLERNGLIEKIGNRSRSSSGVSGSGSSSITVCHAQTVREINRVGEGLRLRVHFIRKASDDVKKCGSKLLRKFGTYCTGAGYMLYIKLSK